MVQLLVGSLVMLACFGLPALLVWRRRRAMQAGHTDETPAAEQKPEPLISLVLLLRAPRDLNKEQVHELALRAYADIGEDPEVGKYVEVGQFQPNMFPVLVNGRRLAVIYSGEPYVSDVLAASDKIADPRLRMAVRAHKAWVSVDWFGELTDPDRPEAYRFIGLLLAELTGPDCLAVYSTERGHLTMYESSVPGKLRGPSARAAFVDDPVVHIGKDDKRMAAAQEEARRRWPEFVAAFERRQPGEVFSAKAPFRQDDKTEYMWVTVTAIENDAVFGTLDNEPGMISELRLGQRVRFPVSDLNDWLYKSGDAMHGGFTIAVLRSDGADPSK